MRGKGIELGTGGKGENGCRRNGGCFSGRNGGLNSGWISRLGGWESSGLFSGL